jgi:type IV secretion system protein TrbI
VVSEPLRPSDDALAVAMRLRPEWPPVTRLSRKVLATLAAIATAAILGALVFALQAHAPRPDATKLYATDHKTMADAIETLPKDYTALPQLPPPQPIPHLGPPLAGNLDRPLLAALGSEPGATDQKIAQENDAARVSRLFATINTQPETLSGLLVPGGATAAGSPAAAAKPPLDPGSLQNMQDRKLAFLNAATDTGTVSPDAVKPPPSRYVVQAGSIIAAALITGIRSDLPGEITAQVTENVYDSPTGRFLLIPQGARLIGRYDSEVAFGQSRVLLVWTRIIMPNGSSITLDHQPGADGAGYAGLEDDVDYHWGDLAKAAVLSTLLGIGSELVLNSNNAIVEALRTGTQDTINQSGQTLVSRELNVQPTLTIQPGFPVRVLVNRDLVFVPYKG